MTVGLLSFAYTPGRPLNGGRSQVNIGSLQFAFLDLMKTGQSWNNGGGPNANGQVTPANMDANGYPTTIGTNGYYTTIFIPPTTVRPGNYVFRWTGGDVTTSMRNPGTLVSGSTTGANGRFVFTPNASPVAEAPQFGPTVLGTPYVTSMSLMHVNDEAAWLAGDVFGTKFKAILSQANFGVIRFLNQQPSITNVTTWATRKPVAYFSYAADEYRSSLWAGQTTNVGNDYSITFGSGAPVDKQTILLQFNTAATLNKATVTFPGSSTINWASHGLSAGDVVGFNGGSPPTGIFYGGTYYVIASGLTANSFQISLTRGGSAYNYGTGGSGTITGSRIPTLNLNSTGTVAIVNSTGNIMTGTGELPSPVNVGGTACWACLVYDADLNSWLLNGGNTQQGSSGIINGCPYEIMLQLCKEIGAHPHFVAPYLAVDPMTDFHTQLATYIKASMPEWMIPRFETVNEPWNNNNPMTQYAYAKAFAHWNAQFAGGLFDIQNWIGKTASTMGQAVNAAYGGAVGAGYQILVGVQTSDFANPGANGKTARLESTEYVAQSASAQSGYAKSAASLWMTHLLSANYFNPSRRGTAQEGTDAATFASNAAKIRASISGGTLTVGSVINGTLVIGQELNDQYGFIPAGVTITGGSGTSWTVSDGSLSIMVGTVMYALNATARSLATSYADTTAGAADGNDNLAQLKILATNIFNWAKTYINSAGQALKGTFYEGGYSPDLDSTAQINALRNASKMVADIGVTIGGGTLTSGANVAGNYADCIAAGGEYPSCFELAGTDNIWAVLDPDIYATQTAQWAAIVAFNH